MSTFRGLKIVQTTPQLIVEIYDSAISLYAETIAQGQSGILWPSAQAQSYTPAWHQFAVGAMTEAAGLGAFGSAKATDLGVDWISYIDGPQLQLLLGNLVTAKAEGYLPYAPTLGAYVTAAEITARYTNLAAFGAANGNLWIGTGPMYLAQVDALAGITVLKNNPDYFYAAGHYIGRGFDEVAIPDVAVTRYDETVYIGAPAVFYIDVTLNGEAYAEENIKEIVYLLIDAEGNIAESGNGVVFGDGEARVTIADTSGLPEGANRLEIVVVVKTVVIPGNAQISFTTLR
jgi:peptide/nickel transport system substrate-binding protein